MQGRSRTLEVDAERLHAALARLFPDPQPDAQRLAVAMAVTRASTIITGGPGTGKTTTVARLLAVLRELDPQITIGLAAPTGKAAARLQEAVAEAIDSLGGVDLIRVGHPPAVTLHRLLGWIPRSQSRFAHHAGNPLPHDVVVVDESSMVALPMMARLVEAVRPDARLVLVGDADQLASVDAGAVLGDLVARRRLGLDLPRAARPSGRSLLATPLPADRPGARPPAGGRPPGAAPPAAAGIAELSRGHPAWRRCAVLATAPPRDHPDLDFHDDRRQPANLGPAGGAVRARVVPAGERVVERRDRRRRRRRPRGPRRPNRALCAHRRGADGVGDGTTSIDAWASAAPPARPRPVVPGRPILVTATTPPPGSHNGDTGVIIAEPTVAR